VCIPPPSRLSCPPVKVSKSCKEGQGREQRPLGMHALGRTTDSRCLTWQGPAHQAQGTRKYDLICSRSFHNVPPLPLSRLINHRRNGMNTHHTDSSNASTLHESAHKTKDKTRPSSCVTKNAGLSCSQRKLDPFFSLLWMLPDSGHWVRRGGVYK
jgi:hypothetical protein